MMNIKVLLEYLRARPIWPLALLFSVIYLPRLMSQEIFLYDSLRFFSIDRIPSVYSLEYIIDIFTKTTNGPQYRPFSFYVYTLITKTIFGHSLWAYNLLGFSMFIMNLGLIFKISEHINISRFYRGLSVFIFGLNINWNYSFQNDYFAKYHLVLLCLLVGIYLILKDEKVSFKTLVLLFCIQLFTFINHEGSLTFFFVWLLCYYLKYKHIKNSLLSLSIPTIVYLVFRVFIHEIPKSGFMKVDISAVPTVGTFYIGGSWGGVVQIFNYLFPLYGDTFLTINLFLVLIFVSVFTFKYKDYRVLSLFIISLVLISPFSLLKNHYSPVRAMWAYPFFSMALGVMFSSITKKYSIAKYFISIYLSFYFLGSLYVKYSMIDPQIVNREAELLDFRDRLQIQIDSHSKDEKLDIDVYTEKSGYFYDVVYYPSVVASYAKLNNTARVRVFSKGELRSQTIIENGARYEVSDAKEHDHFNVVDLFRNSRDMQFKADQKLRIDLD